MIEPVQPRLRTVFSPSLDVTASVGVRRLANDVRAAPILVQPPTRPRGRRRAGAVAAAAFATLALAFLVAEVRLAPGETTGTKRFALFTPPTTGDVSVGVGTPQRGSSSNARVTAETRAKPRPSSSLPPSQAGTPPASFPRRFAWAPEEEASGYHFELFRGNFLVFAKDTTQAQITIPAKWKFDRREYQFEPVGYRWYVWPIVSGKRTTKAVVQARLVVRDR